MGVFPMKNGLLLVIKGISILLISGVLGLELWNLRAAIAQTPIFVLPDLVVWGGRFALVAHGIEGVVAAIYASRQQKAPIPYALYTFFVGTVGLVELFTPAPDSPDPSQG